MHRDVKLFTRLVFLQVLIKVLHVLEEYGSLYFKFFLNLPDLVIDIDDNTISYIKKMLLESNWCTIGILLTIESLVGKVVMRH